jgi:hypothetical protein
METLYLFACTGSHAAALTTDPTGKNIPIEKCKAGWSFVHKVEFNPAEADSSTGFGGVGNADDVLRSIRQRGYYVRSTDLSSGPEKQG